MNILYVANKFPKLSESFILNELYELDERGHTVSVFSLNEPDEDISHNEIQKLDVTTHYAELSVLRSFSSLFSKYVLNRSVLQSTMFIDTPFYHSKCLRLGRQIIETVERNDIDLIHAHFATSNRLAVTYAASYHNIPCTVTAL